MIELKGIEEPVTPKKIIRPDRPRVINLYRDHYQNFKQYNIPKAQLVIADIPYNLDNKAYASNPSWYVGGDNKNGESKLAGKSFFDGDKDFNVNEFFHFCSKLIKPEPKEKGQAGCMIIFCEFEQQFALIDIARKYGFMNYINLVFRKNFSAQVLKANMRIVGNCEYGMLFYRDKLPKFNNNGKMIFNCLDWEKDQKEKKWHPTQKPLRVLRQLIQLFTDPEDIVIDPVAGGGSSLIASYLEGRSSYGFEIKKKFYEAALERIEEHKSQGVLF